MSEPSRRAERGPRGTGEHLELLRRVTAQMTVHHTLREVLEAITRGLVQNAGAALARIWLFTEADRCPVWRSGCAASRSTRPTSR